MSLDIVIAWVDSESAVFKSNWHSSCNQLTPSPNYINSGELFYCLDSLKFLHGNLGKVFLVTDGTHPPSGYIPEYIRAKIQMVHHDEIIPANLLPTFSSHVIGNFLFKIPKLSQDFIYFNDDIFLTSKCSISYFFSKDSFTNLKFTKKELTLTNNADWNTILGPTIALLNNALGKKLRYQNPHTPMLYNKSLVEEVFDYFRLDSLYRHNPKLNSEITYNLRLLYSYYLLNKRLNLGSDELDFEEQNMFSGPKDVISLNLNEDNFHENAAKIVQSRPMFVNIQSVSKPPLIRELLHATENSLKMR
jgi:hypothetical protein